MKKPDPKQYYDYQQCKSYLKEVYNLPELTFYNFIQYFSDSISGQDSILSLSEESLGGEFDDVIRLLIDEFGDPERELELKIWW